MRIPLRRPVLWLIAFLLTYAVIISSLFVPPPPGTHKALDEGAKKISSVAEQVKDTVSGGGGTASPDQSSATVSQPTTRRATPASVLRGAMIIFLNNLRADLLFGSPLLGPLIYFVAIMVNGWILRYIAIKLYGEALGVKVALAVMTMPHAVLETTAYSIAFVEGGILSYYILKRRGELKEAVKKYGIYMSLSLTILFIAAIIEAWTLAPR